MKIKNMKVNRIKPGLLKNKNQLVFLAALLGLTLLGIYSFPLPAAAQTEDRTEVVAIVGARIVPVTGPVIESGSILIKNGRIADLGANISIPSGAKVIEARGLVAYPGMIDSYSWLGLEEISGVRATVDNRETGRINPQVKAIEALRYDSMHIPIARANGIVAAVVAPSGGLISGQSTLVKLDGWTNREMVIKESLAMIIELPALRRGRGEFAGFRGQQPQVTTEKTLDELRQIFEKARMYEKRREAARKNILLPPPDFDEASHFLLPVVKGELPVIFSVHADKDILQTIKFVQEEKIKAIFYGVEQGFKVAKEIKEAGIPCIIGSLYSLPPVWEDGYDALFLNPVILNQAGVKISFSSSSASTAKDLPYHAAKAAAFGLKPEEALKAVTIYPAEIFGVDKLLGSLEPGKTASIVLADGDLLELGTKIQKVFIDGKEVSLENRYTELLKKFEQREADK
ncbi:MAG TPA: amidohydrolase family protein [Candidatus Saccharicenans sp.]|nr:amidohydrolase family protein [Candidatus Saccharicenans sp.]HPC88415.1 amidohydrolase family protein [Candidatus Saccharicenans sp.]HQE64678.1 amidohydrolase family protein [Candidatus Saccharicenans sp.]HQH61348.1 amidohydrolase family protein [Candidatus Saccharicenans sp.]